MNVQQFEAWKKSHPSYKRSILRQKKIKLRNLTKLIAAMERNI